MKKDEDYEVASEHERATDYYDGEKELTKGQARGIIIIISLLFIGLSVWAVLLMDGRYARLLEKEAELEEELEEEQARQDELLEEADALCKERVQRYTSDGVLELDAFLISYGFTPTETGWIHDDEKLLFDFSQETGLALMYQKNGKEYRREVVAHKGAVDDYYCKLGAQTLTLSQSDVRAIGRVLLGNTSGFDKME
jgi:alanyl-tRNA synthetase